jgi:DNA polymerase III sliding clamp (beta) subunit (PCNA family)
MSRFCANGLQQVVFAASPSETRPEISGVLFSWNGAGTLSLAATDSYRLSERQLALPRRTGAAGDVIVPAKTAHELVARLWDSLKRVRILIEISIGENQVGFSSGNTVDRLARDRGPLPGLQTDHPGEDRVRGFGRPSSRFPAPPARPDSSVSNGLNDVQLRVNKANNMITVVGRDAQTGEQTVDVPCVVKGADALVTLNYRYLLDGLNAITHDKDLNRFNRRQLRRPHPPRRPRRPDFSTSSCQ